MREATDDGRKYTARVASCLTRPWAKTGKMALLVTPRWTGAPSRPYGDDGTPSSLPLSGRLPLGTVWLFGTIKFLLRSINSLDTEEMALWYVREGNRRMIRERKRNVKEW